MRGLNLLKEEKRVYWKFSSKWLSKQLDCTLNGILTKCGAGCCRNDRVKFWPPSSGQDGKCPWLGEKGCKLPWENRPIECLMAPLVVRNNSVGLHIYAVTIKGGTCNKCYKSGPRVVDALADCLILLFGVDNYKRIKEGVDNDLDISVELSKVFLERLQHEETLKNNNIVPALENLSR